MGIKELLEKKDALKSEIRAILDVCETEKRTLNQDEVDLFEEKENELKLLNRNIEIEMSKRQFIEDDPVVVAKKDENDIEKRELEDFECFIKNSILEKRDNEIQLTQGANGGIVPTTITNKIITKVRDNVPYLQLAEVIQTNGKLSVPVYTEDSTNYINADYVEEGTSLIDNIGSIGTVDLTGYVIGALSLISKKLINNTDINVTDFVIKEVVRAISDKLNREFTLGTSNKITGIISSTSRVTASKATSLTWDELIDLKHSIKQGFRKNGVWIMNDATYKAICKLEDKNGRKYIENADKYEILNRPVYVNDDMPTIAASAKTIFFGDLSGYTIKATSTNELEILREAFAEKHMIGIIDYVEYDAKITDSQKMGLLTMGASD